MAAISLAVRPAADAGDRAKRGLPAWTYSNAELARLEHERVLLPSWQIVCHVSSVARPGDYFTFDLGPDSVLVLRGQDGEIRAFHNVCRHRAARLAEGQGKCPGVITCPYHGWSYGLDGALRGVPLRESFPGLDRDALGLLPVRSEVLLGFVFVCLAGDPVPLAQTWAEFLPDFEPYRFAEMQPLAPIYEERWNVDWKVAMDNYLESYHVPIGHPGLNRMFTPDLADQNNAAAGIARSIGWMRERPSTAWSEYRYQALVESVTADLLPPENRKSWRFYSMLPNLGIDVFPDQMDFFQVLPDGPGRCIIRGGTFGLPDNRREMRVLRYLNARINRQVQREDAFLCARVQRGLASSFYTPGPLSEHESCVAQFHDLIRAAIPAVRETVAPSRLA
jgi:phenylpropionate dioxygenase-like ring-hydroxylating dioxygenase large terminal subunit